MIDPEMQFSFLDSIKDRQEDLRETMGLDVESYLAGQLDDPEEIEDIESILFFDLFEYPELRAVALVHQTCLAISEHLSEPYKGPVQKMLRTWTPKSGDTLGVGEREWPVLAQVWENAAGKLGLAHIRALDMVNTCSSYWEIKQYLIECQLRINRKHW